MSIRPWSPFRQVRRAESREGAVLVLAVFAVVLLAVLAVAITAAVRVELLASRATLERMQSLFLAQAGLQRARAILLYEGQTVDTLWDVWGPRSESPLDVPHALGDGYYQVRVLDASGRINVNLADGLPGQGWTEPPRYDNLYGALVRLTGSPQAAAAIIDWRDGGSLPLVEGAEQGYYTALAHPYLPRNGPLQTLGELLLVRGVTPDMFFGNEQRLGLADLLTVESLSLETNAAGRQRLGVNRLLNSWDMADWREQVLKEWGELLSEAIVGKLMAWRSNLPQEQYTSLAQIAEVLRFYGYDFLSAMDDLCIDVQTPAHAGMQGPLGWIYPPVSGKVNVNTAGAEVLAGLPGCSVEVAEAIVARREDEPFASLTDVAGFLWSQSDGPQVFEGMIDHVTTKSSSFIIESTGWTGAGRAFCTLRALVRRRPDNVIVVQQSELDWRLPSAEQGQIMVARR